jgi:iron(III) transport system permease protein
VICIVAVFFYRRATRNAEAFATITGKGYMPTRIKLRKWRWPVALGVLADVLPGARPCRCSRWCGSRSSAIWRSRSWLDLAGDLRELRVHPALSDLPQCGEDQRIAGGDGGDHRGRPHLRHGWIALRAAPKSGWVLDSIAFTPIAMPHVIVGAAILFAYLMLPIPVYNTIWILLIAYVTLYLPYGMRFISGGLTQIHKELEESPRSRAPACGRCSSGFCCRCSRRCCWRRGSTSSCWRCASSAPRCS